MGLMDILNGMQNGPRGGTGGASAAGHSGGMSPLTMALLGLLAYKAVKSFGGSSATAATAPDPGGTPTAPHGAPAGGLGLDDILGGKLGQGSGGLGGVLGSVLGGGGAGAGGLGGVLGSVLGGAGAGAGGLGGVLSGGLGDLLEQFHGAGRGDAATSWVGTGQNQPISPHDLSRVLTTEQVDFLMQRTGLSREELLAGLSEQLPAVVDQLTPAGRLPTADEINRAA